VKAFAEAEGLTFTILLDQAGQAAKSYDVRGVPSTFFIDRQGMIQARHAGPMDRALLEQLLAEHLN